MFTFLAGKAKLAPGDKGAAAFALALAVGAAPVHLVSGDQCEQVGIGLLVGQPTGDPFLDPRQYRLRIVLSDDGGVSDPQEYVVVRSAMYLVFLPVEVVYLAKYRTFLHNGAKEGMESQRKLPAHQDGVLGAELGDVVRRWHVVDLPELAGNFGGLVFGTAEGEEEGGRTPLAYHTPELSLSGKPELLGAAYRLKHGGQVGFEGLVGGLHLLQEHADRHGPRSGGFQQVVDACRQLSQFLPPQQVEDILRVFAEERILVEELRLDVLAVRQLDLALMVLAKPSGGEEHREAHDVEVLLSVVQGILPDAEHFVLLQVGVA